MQVDWVTVAAQVVNFLILVYLLKRFLYAPVMDAMGRRESRIRERLEEARQREKQADDAIERHERELRELDQRREELMDKAERHADEHRQRLMDEAREEAGEARDRWQHEVEREREEFMRGLRRNTAALVEEVSRAALAGLADAGLEAQLIDNFLGRLEALDDDSRARLADAGDELCVTTAFELEPGTRARITRAIHQHVAQDLDVAYRESDELVCGIEIAVGGWRVGWSVADYLRELDSRMSEQFEPVG